MAALFYRAQVQAGNTAFVDTFCQRLRAQGLNPLPIAVASLKEAECLAQVEAWLDETDTAVILNTTGFAQSNPDAPQERPFRRDVPVLQALCALDSEQQWAGQRPGPGAARPGHAHRPARAGRSPDHPADQLKGVAAQRA